MARQCWEPKNSRPSDKCPVVQGKFLGTWGLPGHVLKRGVWRESTCSAGACWGRILMKQQMCGYGVRLKFVAYRAEPRTIRSWDPSETLWAGRDAMGCLPKTSKFLHVSCSGSRAVCTRKFLPKQLQLVSAIFCDIWISNNLILLSSPLLTTNPTTVTACIPIDHSDKAKQPRTTCVVGQDSSLEVNWLSRKRCLGQLKMQMR